MTEFHRLRSRNDNVDPKWQQWNDMATRRAKEHPNATMPSLDHCNYQDFYHVYEPAEDTFLLIDAIKYEFDHDEFSQNCYSILEIGCGSGTVLTYFAMQYQTTYRNSTCACWATDLNPRALEMTQNTTKENGLALPIELVQCSLASSFKTTFDVILFNPPYVPNDSDSKDHDVLGMIASAWDGGGTDGNESSWAFWESQLAAHLTPHTGRAYVITVDENRPHDRLAPCCERQGLRMKPLLRRRAYNEHLTVQKITWKSSSNTQS